MFGANPLGAANAVLEEQGSRSFRDVLRDLGRELRDIWPGKVISHANT